MQHSLPFSVPYVRFAQVVRWPAHNEHGPRRLYDHELVYVVNGSLQMWLDDTKVDVARDQVVLIRPREKHVFRTGNEPVHDVIGIHFDWEPRADTRGFQTFRPAEEPFEHELFRTPRLIPGWDADAATLLDLQGRSAVHKLLNEVIAAHAVPGEYARVKAGALLAAAIAQISHEAGLTQHFDASAHIGADAVRRAHRARELLEAPHTPALAVNEAAAQVGWSADHLGKMFRAIYGVSPHKVQMQARLRRARELLRYSHLGIAQVASQCGFRDASHFMTTFKKGTGLTPSQFARLQAKENVVLEGGEQ